MGPAASVALAFVAVGEVGLRTPRGKPNAQRTPRSTSADSSRKAGDSVGRRSPIVRPRTTLSPRRLVAN